MGDSILIQAIEPQKISQHAGSGDHEGGLLSGVVVSSRSAGRKIWHTDRIMDLITSNLTVPDLCRIAVVNKKGRDTAYKTDVWEWRLKNCNVNFKTSNTQTGFGDLSPLSTFDDFYYNGTNAREGVLRIYRSLSTFYYDLILSGQEQPIVFEEFPVPEDQAKCLNQLKHFSAIEPAYQVKNELKIMTTIDLFESAALAEFEAGLDNHDLEKMRTYAYALIALNGGESCVQLFIQKHKLLNPGAVTESRHKGIDSSSKHANEQDDLARDRVESTDDTDDPSRFLEPDKKWRLNVEKFHDYLDAIAVELNETESTIEKVFPQGTPVLVPFFERVLEENIMEVVSSITELSHQKSPKVGYLNVVPEIYAQLMKFCELIKPGNESSSSAHSLPLQISTAIDDMYNLYMNAYLSEELQTFTEYAEEQVTKWSNTISQQDANAESIFLNHLNRAKEKSDFLSSFKRVLMISGNGSSSNLSSQNNNSPSSGDNSNDNDDSRKQKGEYATDLEARTAMMNQKLENIKSLFSLELALDLVRAGKESIERMGKFKTNDAKNQCELVFVELIHTVGQRHVKGGFDKALATLYQYDPKQHRKLVATAAESRELADGGTAAAGDEICARNGEAVEPLAIFAELVNIGDLIQQMIHVFFEQELVTRRLVDSTDFLSPAVKAKRKFEQTLDDCVANGLNRGIDVLIDQIDFLFVTMQLGSDYNPMPSSAPGSAPGGFVADIGPTNAARMVVAALSAHMTLLAGSTEKSVLDVFQQEVGLRFFHSICKHIKRQIISVEGAITLISDLNFYYDFIVKLKQRELIPYFAALKEVGQLFLIDGSDARALGQTLSDMVRFRGVFKPEELMEFVQRRKDWLLVKRDVEKVMYGFGIDCIIV